MPKADDRAWEGVWIGVTLGTDEHLIEKAWTVQLQNRTQKATE